MNLTTESPLHHPQTVLNRFSFLVPDYQVNGLGNAGGFSGSRIWKITSGMEHYCLKKWPSSHPGHERLVFIHSVLQHVFRQGLNVVAVPQQNDYGHTIMQYEGALYELTRWLPGEADYEFRPSENKLIAAMSVLAEFHLRAAIFSAVSIGPSPGILDRCRQLAGLRSGEMQRIAAAIRPLDWPVLAELGRAFIDLLPRVMPRLGYELERASAWNVHLQPCIRDIWHDHVLFTNEQVTGLIDFGSLRMENVAGDIARLMGSLAGDDPRQRQIALDAYCKLGPLSPQERQLVDIFDRTTIALGGVNWLRWIYCEGRVFSDRAKVERRFRLLLGRLQYLAMTS